ncbi:hypothetical protein [Cohnella thailandensis]|uniref:Uncharacterized protein n=1 Tax=Cohnella thailandensis TaxID=557557 RepID=A0A841T9Q2_9BACL|nr:hypothetical protein [Cohnella thailandensis]MBB6637941.1 hypothetical protein [Cohnella thailandensis]MBP1977721.1 hypothetical protein [Cohnella thailandensis]
MEPSVDAYIGTRMDASLIPARQPVPDARRRKMERTWRRSMQAGGSRRAGQAGRRNGHRQIFGGIGRQGSILTRGP